MAPVVGFVEVVIFVAVAVGPVVVVVVGGVARTGANASFLGTQRKMIFPTSLPLSSVPSS